MTDKPNVAVFCTDTVAVGGGGSAELGLVSTCLLPVCNPAPPAGTHTHNYCVKLAPVPACSPARFVCVLLTLLSSSGLTGVNPVWPNHAKDLSKEFPECCLFSGIWTFCLCKKPIPPPLHCGVCHATRCMFRLQIQSASSCKSINRCLGSRHRFFFFFFQLMHFISKAFFSLLPPLVSLK